MDQRRADIVIDLLLGRAAPTAVDLQLVVPVASVEGSSQEPAWVPGLGPVSGGEVREWLGGLLPCADVVSNLDVRQVDAATGRLTDLIETGYRPSRALDLAVRAPDVTCRFPGCRRAASGRGSGTDLDHTVPWPEGPTSASNLAVLCRRHHRLKHSPDWQVTLHADGAMTWITPTGRRYQSEPWQYTDASCPEMDRWAPRDIDSVDNDPDPPELE